MPCLRILLSAHLTIVCIRPVLARVVLFQNVPRSRADFRVQGQGQQRHVRHIFERDGVLD